MTKRLNARSVALDVVLAVSQDDAYANLLLPSRISAARLDARDAGLATELCHGTLRNRATYDAIISNCTDRTLDKIHPVVRSALEMGSHQHMAMRVSTHALVNETVQLVRDSGMAAVTGFTNAVMRRITERTPAQWHEILGAAASNETQKLELRYSHPSWIIRAFESALAHDNRQGQIVDVLQADNESSPLGIADLRTGGDELSLVVPSRYSPFGFHLENSGNPSVVTSKHSGFVRVQDEGSQLAALALIAARPVDPAEEWLDMCAAPGGKSAVLAHFAHTAQSAVIANEANPSRVSLLERAVAPWPNTSVTNRDGRDFAGENECFDRVLVDAPCSGLGALRRRPEARWRKTPSDISALTTLQEELLLAACDATKPDGLIAYVTCSPHLAETRAIVNAALKKRPELSELNVASLLNSVTRHPIPTEGPGPSLQLWPHAHNTDAMFIALLTKSA